MLEFNYSKKSRDQRRREKNRRKIIKAIGWSIWGTALTIPTAGLLGGTADLILKDQEAREARQTISLTDWREIQASPTGRVFTANHTPFRLEKTSDGSVLVHLPYSQRHLNTIRRLGRLFADSTVIDKIPSEKLETLIADRQKELTKEMKRKEQELQNIREQLAPLPKKSKSFLSSQQSIAAKARIGNNVTHG
ncbi:MAG: hypothetical protein ACOY3I_05565 [Verrucomicrobiota bacterium]